VDEVIELTLPAVPELMSLARFTAATLGARAEFSMDEIEDLRLGANELCLSMLNGARGSAMHLRFSREGDTVEISCEVESSEIGAWSGTGLDSEWSLRILDAVVTEHGRDLKGLRGRAWLRKRRGTSTLP